MTSTCKPIHKKMNQFPSKSIVCYEQRQEVPMSFTGIFRAKDGLAAVVDSKGSRIESGQLVEDYVRSPKKFFPFNGGVAVTYGANQIKIKNHRKEDRNAIHKETACL